MSTFFINRPIVAMVISIIMVIAGVVSMLSLPVAQFPNIVPPQIQVTTTYVGADALTVEQSVATPIEQQMSGVDQMEYMYSVNANNGGMTLYVTFEIGTDANTDQILAQMRQSQADSQMPGPVRDYGVTVRKSTSAPLMLVSLYSPNDSYDSIYLANYAYINLNDAILRVPGVGQVTVFGAGQYAMRFWVKPDQLAKLNITIPEMLNALQQQNAVNPAGQIGGEPIPTGQEFTYAIRAQGRLTTPEEFGDIIVRANPDGSAVRMRDLARIELGAQSYGFSGRLNGKPSAVVAIYQLPGSNAITTVDGIKALMEETRSRFPSDLDYVVSLDTTLAVREGMKDIEHTLIEAMVLVILVVFLFLQGWRATLIPLLAVPVSLIGTFMVFPLLGFSINTLSLFGLVLAIGLVVDDAIVVVEAVEHHIEEGLSPRDATLKAMQEVTGPVIGIALVLSAVFIPTAFIPGITGRLYQQFAVTIAISVIISAFNALTLSPALSALLLRPRKQGRGPLAMFFRGFNKVFNGLTHAYVGVSRVMARGFIITVVLLGAIAFGTGVLGSRIATGFVPDEDQGYFFINVTLPKAASQQRTADACRKVEAILANTPGIQYATTVVGYNLIAQVNTTYSGLFFVSLKSWEERTSPELQIQAIMAGINRQLAEIPDCVAFSFLPPAIPGVGSAGGVQFILQDRSGRDIDYLAQQTTAFVDAARKRPELAGVNTNLLVGVPQIFVDVDRAKVLKQGVQLQDVYRTLQTFMGGSFVNYFNRFGRQWQVYVQAEGDYRTNVRELERFYVRNAAGDPVPLSALTQVRVVSGPEFTLRFNLYRSAQVNAVAAPGYSSAQAMKALEEVFAANMPSDMGYDYTGMSYQEKQAQQGVSPIAIFGLSLLFVFLILAALYESWSLPFSVLLSTPVAVAGAFVALTWREQINNVYAQIGLVMLIGLAAKNAILIVEFAKMEVENGVPLLEATLKGARLRLRPILMTSFAFVLGCVPLAIATGSGAVSRQILGTVVIGGMLASTVVAVFFIPALFYMVERITGRGERIGRERAAAKMAAAAKPETAQAAH